MGAAVFGVGQGYSGNNATTQSGTDLLENVAVTNTTFTTGEIVTQALLSPQSTRRLADLASTFQRIRYNKLRFTIEGSFSSTSGGGFIAAFVRDPTDVPPDDAMERLRWAMSRSCVVDCKWYDCGVVDVPKGPDLLYTSIDKDDSRLWSPGQLIVISKGGPGTPGSLTIKMDWNVTLSMPSTEIVSKSSEIRAPHDLYIDFNVTGFCSLKALKTHAPDPHNQVYKYADWSFLGAKDGDMLLFDEPITITGMYNTGNDYVPIRCDRALFHTRYDGFQCTLVCNGYTVQHGSTPTDVGFPISNWHILSGGVGNVIPTGKLLNLQRVGEMRTAKTTNLFTPHGIVEREIAGTQIVKAPIVRPAVTTDWPTVNVAGEASAE